MSQVAEQGTNNTLDLMKKLVNEHTRVRVRISDGRLIEGEIQCIDLHENLIVVGAVEYHGIAQDDGSALDATSTRSVGTVMVPGNHIVKIMAIL